MRTWALGLVAVLLATASDRGIAQNANALTLRDFVIEPRTMTVTTEAGEKVTLDRGESLYLSPDDRGATVHGLGEVAQAYVPPTRSLRSRLVNMV